jgi:glycosyltransferase involved in cell wall biosynthesis
VRGASTRYRIVAHRPGLEAAGFRTELRLPLTLDAHAASRRLWRLIDLMRDVALAARPRFDLVLIHRKTYPPPFASRLRRRVARLVFDLDDALDLPPPGPRLRPAVLRRYRRNFEATVGACDLVLAGSRELASRLPHERYELLPTPIDTLRFAPDRIGRARGPVLGWVGHSGNLAYLESLAGPLRELDRRHPGLRLIVAADRAPRMPGLDVEFRRWSLDREVSCFDGIGVGLMPLDDTPWARGKCAFKAIQYMALGIPAVVSPVGMNRDLVRDGENGLVAEDEAGWVRAVDRLFRDPGFAQRIAREGRKTVERDYALQVVSRKLVAIMHDVLGRASRNL